MSHALAVLGWLELEEDERPPERIWLDNQALADHFERLNEKRKSKASGMEPIEVDDSAPMLQNEITKNWR